MCADGMKNVTIHQSIFSNNSAKSDLLESIAGGSIFARTDYFHMHDSVCVGSSLTGECGVYSSSIHCVDMTVLLMIIRDVHICTPACLCFHTGIQLD